MDTDQEEGAPHYEDSSAMHKLLQEGIFLLHIAASTGQTGLVREILTRKPNLGRDPNEEGLSALHLASANGHVSVVKELVKIIGSDLCLLRDNNGWMPIHTAAMEGKIHVLKELMDACSESARARTDRGETVLHLGIKSKCFEAVKFLVERVDDELFNCEDEEGNTVLHLAVATRQLQITKFLLSKRRMDVNAVNLKGFTALNVLLDSPSEPGDLLLGEMIVASGGKLTREGNSRLLQSQGCVHLPTYNSVTRSLAPEPQNRSNVVNRCEEEGKTWQLNANPDTLMLVATLIVTITFQAGLNPPGGFVQSNDNGNSPGTSPPGQAVLGDHLYGFLLFDMIGLFASLSIILLLICVVPRRKRMVIGILVWVMWVAVFCTGLAYSFAIREIFQEVGMVVMLNYGWKGVFGVASLWICIQFIRHLLKKVGLLKKGTNAKKGTSLILQIIVVVLSVFLLFASVGIALFLVGLF